MLKYIELKSGYSDNGPAWIGLAEQSKSGKTIYFNGQAFRRGNCVAGNHFDIETGEEYWISSVKKDGADRHWAGVGKIGIEVAAVKEYLKLVEKDALDVSKFEVLNDIVPTDISKFNEMQNERCR